jgi:hypothetical protein
MELTELERGVVTTAAYGRRTWRGDDSTALEQSGAEVLMAERFDLRFGGAYYGLFVETLELGEHACC